MLVDRPPPNCPARQVIIIEEKDKPYTVLFVDQVIEKARASDATSRDADNDEIFWVVFGNEPERVCGMTDWELRSRLRRPRSERMPAERLIAMGYDAPIGEILETFDYGGLVSFARRDMPMVCREHQVSTLGEIAKLAQSEITGPLCRYAGNKTLSYLDAVLSDFGKPPLNVFPVPLSEDESNYIASHGLKNF